MQTSGFSPSEPLKIERPPCPSCQTPMRLTRIEPAGPGMDRRSFECDSCQHSETVEIKLT